MVSPAHGTLTVVCANGILGVIIRNSSDWFGDIWRSERSHHTDGCMLSLLVRSAYIFTRALCSNRRWIQDICRSIPFRLSACPDDLV